MALRVGVNYIVYGMTPDSDVCVAVQVSADGVPARSAVAAQRMAALAAGARPRAYRSVAGLGALVGRRASDTSVAGRWRCRLIWLVQMVDGGAGAGAAVATAIAVSELVPQANVIAVLVDDSHSMSIADPWRHPNAAG